MPIYWSVITKCWHCFLNYKKTALWFFGARTPFATRQICWNATQDMEDEPIWLIHVCPLDCCGLYALCVCVCAYEHVQIFLRMRWFSLYLLVPYIFSCYCIVTWTKCWLHWFAYCLPVVIISYVKSTWSEFGSVCRNLLPHIRVWMITIMEHKV